MPLQRYGQAAEVAGALRDLGFDDIRVLPGTFDLVTAIVPR